MDRLLTVDQAGELWNNGPRFVRRLIAERRIELVAHGSACANRRKCIDQVVEAGSWRPCRFLLQVDINECGSPTLRQTSAITFRALSGARYRPRQSTADSSSDFPGRTLARRRLSKQEFPAFNGLQTALELIMKRIGGDWLPKIN